MKTSEQFKLRWDQVSLNRRTVSLYETKVKRARHIQLNAVALDAFRRLKRGSKADGLVHLNIGEALLRRSRDWFEPAIKLARSEIILSTVTVAPLPAVW